MDKAIKVIIIVAIIGVAAILAFIMMGMVLWQSGAFNPTERTIERTGVGMDGFGLLKPVEWHCKVGPGITDTLRLTMVNDAGENINNITIWLSGSNEKVYQGNLWGGYICDQSFLSAGGTTECSINKADCDADAAGKGFYVMLYVQYNTPSGEAVEDLGAVWGIAE